ncbi:MAG: Na+/H+ antiporter subunit G [Spirochaetales bacterium]|nr:Na+/H+ antiporter subunit G [Spirochaetales bacterium]
MALFAEILFSIVLLAGSFLVLIGAIGLFKLQDFFMRLHGPTKATTLGLGAILAATWLYFGLTAGEWTVRGILVTFFLFITAPVSAHMMAKAALLLRLGHHSGVPDSTETDEADG